MVWMSFPVIRSVSRPRIRKILFSTKCFLLDEFSSKTACVIRVSAKRTLRCISRPHAATRLVFLGQLYMVIIDHIYKNQLHASTCRLEKFYMVEYWKICFYFPFLSFPILNHVKFGIFFPRLLHC